MMPRLDGLEVCRRLRGSGDDLPILVLTARDAVSDRVAGLDAGADDYLPKPFALEELLARLRALLRRRTPEDIAAAAGRASRWSSPTSSLDPDTREVRRGDRPISLTRTEFSLLELLLANPRRVLTRGADPRAGLGLRLPDHRQRARGLHRLPAPQDRGRRRAAADPHRARRRVRPARHAAVTVTRTRRPRQGRADGSASRASRCSTTSRCAPASACSPRWSPRSRWCWSRRRRSSPCASTSCRRSTPTCCSARPPPRRASWPTPSSSPRSPPRCSAPATSGSRCCSADGRAMLRGGRGVRPAAGRRRAGGRARAQPLLGAHGHGRRCAVPGGGGPGRAGPGAGDRASGWTPTQQVLTKLGVALPVVGGIGVVLGRARRRRRRARRAAARATGSPRRPSGSPPPGTCGRSRSTAPTSWPG